MSAKIRVAALAAVGGIAGTGAIARAQFVWDGGAAPNNNWNSPNNWTADSGSPAAADSAQWTDAGGTPASSTVELTQNEAANDLQVVDRAVTFNLNNFTLAVGGGESAIDGNSADAIFNGPGSVTFGGVLRVGFNTPANAAVTHARLTARNGVAISTGALHMAQYRGAAIVTADGAGTIWTSSGDVFLNHSTSPYNTYLQPRTQLLIKNGARFNHNLDSGTFNVARGTNMHDRIDVDGAGSQLNFTGEGTSLITGGYASNGSTTTWNIINGGVVSHTNPANAEGGIGLSHNNQNDAAGVNTFNISGAGSKMRAATIALSARSTDALFTRGPSVVNVGVGGTLEATNADGGDRSIAVYDRGRLSLQGGTVAAPLTKDVVLMDTGVAGAQATLEGSGTITGGNLRVQGDSIVRPGLSTGTLTLQNGSLAVESASAQLLFELSTSTGAHDRISLAANGQQASIPGVISYSNLGSGNAAQAILDFLVADTINYNAFSTGDITLNTDNLDGILASAGYTKVTGANPTAANEYRYFIANDVSGSLDALRLVLGVPPTGPIISTWTSTTAGNWNDAANWSDGIPNGVDAEAKFLSAISGTSTVFADMPVKAGTLRFNNSNMYHVSGGASLTLEVSSGSALVDVAAGTHKINLPLLIASDTNLSVAGGATLKISDPVTVSAGKVVTQQGDGDVVYESTVTVGPSASIQFGNSSHMNSLALGAAASATVTPGFDKVLRVDNLDVAAGRLDLRDNKLITNKPVGTFNGTSYSGVQGDVASAYNFGAWDQPGLTTSEELAGPNAGSLSNTTTIGVATAEQILFIAPTETGIFAGETVSGATTIAMYTYAGDLNFDGLVDGADYGVIDNSVQFPGTDGYVNGDFNYDGVIDGADYGIIDNTIQLQGAPFPGVVFGAAAEGVTAVPEPASLSVAGIATGVGLTFRRRRRRC